MGQLEDGIRLAHTTTGPPGIDPGGLSLIDDDHLHHAEAMAALFGQHRLGVAIGEGAFVRQANDEFLRIVGRDHAALDVGLTWTDITAPTRGDRDELLGEQVRRDSSSVLVTDFAQPDGARVPVMACVTVTSRPAQRWLALVVDLSPQEQLRRLAQSEAAIVSTLLEDAPIGFALIDPDLRFVRVNNELAAMNGFASAEHEGRAVFDLLPHLREAAEPLLRGVLDTGQPLRDVHIVGYTAADPDHEHTWLESFFPIRLADGPVLGVATIARDVTELVRLQAEIDDKVTRQRDALEDLQASLVPVLPQIDGVELAARYLPSSDQVHLGGDWLDVCLAPDGRLVLLVGDVVGHGPSAVGLTARLSGAVRAAVCTGAGPAAVLGVLNAVLTTDDLAGLATAFVAFLDLATGRLEYASAGHPPPYLRAPQHQAHALDGAEGLMLGCTPGTTYASATTTLPPRGALVLYTDGLIERRGEHLDLGLARLAAAVNTVPRFRAGAAELLEAALDACLTYRERDDDVCVLTLLRSG